MSQRIRLANHSLRVGAVAVALIFLAIIWAGSLGAGTPATTTEGSQARYYEFDSEDRLIRPVGYREWVYVGTPLTPNDMNPPEAAFPNFHNVYIDPAKLGLL